MGRAKAKLIELFSEAQASGLSENDVQRLFTLARQHLEYMGDKDRFKTLRFWADWMLHHELTRHQKVLLRFAEVISQYDESKGRVSFGFLVKDLIEDVSVFLNEILNGQLNENFWSEQRHFDEILTHACHLVEDTPIKPNNKFKYMVRGHDVLIKELRISHGVCWSHYGNILGFNIEAEAEIWDQGDKAGEAVLVAAFLVDPCPCCGRRYLSCSVRKDKALGKGCGRSPVFYEIK